MDATTVKEYIDENIYENNRRAITATKLNSVLISTETAYNTGDKVTFEGDHYICVIDNCTWSPTAYPAAWEKQ